MSKKLNLMADALEDLLEAQRTEPRSMEETKGRNQDLGPSESDERTDRRNERDPRSSAEKRENEDPGIRINESGQIRDHKESYADIRGNLQQQILRGSEKQRRSHETGSSPYPVRPGVTNCPHYVKTGLCSFGSKCRFNHPPDLAPELPKRMWNCKYFLRGDCRFGSSCSYIHSKERDGAETMHQARTIPDSRELDPRERFQYTSDDTVVGYKRVGIEQEGSNDIGWQRMGDQEILQEQRERQAQEIFQEQRERQDQENVQRETEDSVEERRLREMHAHDLENIEKQRREDIQRDRKKARLRLDQIKQTVEWSQTRDLMKEIGFGQSAGTEIKEKKRRRDDIERQRRESRLKLEQMDRTVQLNEGARVREVLPELGLTRKEGDGF